MHIVLEVVDDFQQFFLDFVLEDVVGGPRGTRFRAPLLLGLGEGGAEVSLSTITFTASVLLWWGSLGGFIAM
jgi:hypothetical protein